ncbi:MAG: MotA/TolQ/ExbB proton channel family protein [Kiritimatiellae bacterium]|nr:MotA/TolQ/ExbB proton channel family protein [Kiritimatiellia bacterium]
MKLPGHLRRLTFFASTALFTVAALAQDAPILPPAIPAAQPPALPATLAAEAAVQAAAPAGATSYGMSWGEAWHYGGFIMWILLALSIVMVALVIYFLCVFRPGAVAPRRLQADIRNYIVEGDEGAARRLCEDRPCAFSSVALAALDCIRATQGAEDLQLLRDIVESEGARQADSMLSQAQLLLDLSAIAPMLGLLGTTLGMLKAFGAVAQDVMVAAKPVILAQGVSQAIITTIFGLVVAIPCMAAYAYFRRRASKLVGQLELASAEIVTAVAARRGA